MNELRARNKKVAESRWEKLHNITRNYIRNNNIPHLKARILGYVAGDGNISIRKSKSGMHYVLRFFPDHVSLIKAFNEAFIRIYNKKPIVKKDKNFYQVKVYSKLIILDLLDCANFGIHHWQIPLSILTDKACKREWIRAFFDAEAYVGPQHIKVHSVNQSGLEEIKNMLLNDFHITSKIYSYVPKKPNHSIAYSLMIISKDMRRNYLKTIGFNHKVKMRKLLNLVG